MTTIIGTAAVASLQASIAGITATLQKKREELARLRKALTQLQTVKSQFVSKEPMTEKPELTAKTWHGKHAQDFKDIQNDEIKPDYQELYQTQLAKAIRDIEEKIVQLEKEIAALEASLSAARTAMSAAAAL